MPRAPTIAPPKADIYRSGAKAGFKRSRQMGLEAASKHNKIVAANLRLAMSAVPPYVLGSYAATVLNMALISTVHDSSRFAANWNLSVGPAALPNDGKPDPLQYYQTGESYGSIGGRSRKEDEERWKAYNKGKPRSEQVRSERGGHRLRVITAKRIYYGYKGNKASEAMQLTNGRLYNQIFAALDLNKKGRLQTPKVYLYNPFMNPKYLRPSGDGNTYPENALVGESTLFQMSEEARTSMGAGLVQQRIAELTDIMKAANKAGRIMNPL